LLYCAAAAIRTLDTRFRGCQEIVDWLDRRCASFEASLREAPQDEDFS
jgi:hypothetical protein